MKSTVYALLLFFLLAVSLNLSAQTAPATGPEVIVKEAGKGKPSLVLIPGFACSGAVYDETVAHFQSRYTCYIFTMPGFAGVPAQEAASFSGWVDAVAAYIRVHHLDHPVVMGHSMGGGMALMLAARYPDLLSRVVVVDALPCLGAATNPSFKISEHPDCSGMISRMEKMSDSTFLAMEKRILPGLTTDTAHLPDIARWGVRTDRKTYAEMFCQFSNTDLRDTIQAIRCPVLVLLEAPFAAIKPTVEGQYSKLAGARLEYAGKGLHFIMYDDKEWYLRQLDNFL